MRIKRSLKKLLLLMILGMAVLVLSYGYWMPVLIGWVAGSAGAEVESVSVLEDGGFLLKEVRYAESGVQVTTDEVTLPGLVAYFRYVFSDGESSDDSSIRISKLHVQVEGELGDGSEPARRGESASLAKELDLLNDSIDSLSTWLPAVRAEAIEVQLEEYEQTLFITDFQLHDRQISFELEGSDLIPASSVLMVLHEAEPWKVFVEMPRLECEIEGILEQQATSRWLISAGLRKSSDTDSISMSIELDKDAIGVVRVALDSDIFTIPEEWIARFYPDYPGGYVELSQLDASWDSGEFAGRCEVRGEYDLELGKASRSLEYKAALEVEGDEAQLRVKSLALQAIGAYLKLGEDEIAVDLTTGAPSEPFSMMWQVDLSALPEFGASGHVTGVIEANMLNGQPVLSFDAEGKELRFMEYALEQFTCSARYQDSVLEIRELVCHPNATQEVEPLSISGEIDFSKHQLDLSYKLKVNEVDWLMSYVDDLPLSGAQQLSGTITGTFADPLVSGKVDLGLKILGLEDIDLKGSFTLRMLSDPLHYSFNGVAYRGDNQITMDLEGEYDRDSLSVLLKRFESKDSERPLLTLLDPVRFGWQLSDALPFEKRISIEPFAIEGKGVMVHGHWTQADGLSLSVSNINLLRFDRWAEADLPDIELPLLNVRVTQFSPWLEGTLELSALWEGAEPGVAGINTTIKLGDSGLGINELLLTLEGKPLLTGDIDLPVRMFLTENEKSRYWELLMNAPLQGHMDGSLTQDLARWVRKRTEIDLQGVSISVDLAGTLESPNGKVQVSAASMDASALLADFRFPEVEDFSIDGSFQDKSLHVDSFSFTLNDSAIHGKATLPVDALWQWIERGQQQSLDLLEHLSGELYLERWEVANWTGQLPSVLRRSGHLDGMLKLAPGLDLSAELSFGDIAIRPTENLPSVDSISGRFRLSDRRLVFDEAMARVGSNPVSFEGKIDMSDINALVWEFSAKGENVPVVRTTDMIVRSDIDIRIEQKPDESTPLLSGKLGLRKSTLLVEFDPLAASSSSGVRKAPPFFSVEDEPFAAWRLDVDISGNQFMRVRSPYLSGQLSANFKLDGTFKQPRLIGSVLTDETEVRFPGAKMHIETGEAYIEAARPNVVQLDYSGIARRSNYVISMNVSNTLEDPHVQFNSTPELTKAEIVQLLATGSTQGGGAGNVGLYLGQGLIGSGGMDESWAERLDIEVGEKISRHGRETVTVHYDLTDDYDVRAEYDQYDSYNVDFIWNLFKR